MSDDAATCWACGSHGKIVRHENNDAQFIPHGGSGTLLQIWPDGHWNFECFYCGWEFEDNRELPSLESWLRDQELNGAADEVVRLRDRIAKLEEAIRKHQSKFNPRYAQLADLELWRVVTTDETGG